MNYLEKNRKSVLKIYFGISAIVILILNISDYLYLKDYYFTLGGKITQFTSQEILSMCLERTLLMVVSVILFYLICELVLYIRRRKV